MSFQLACCPPTQRLSIPRLIQSIDRWEGGTPTQNARFRNKIREFRPDFARAESSFATCQARIEHARNNPICILLIRKDLLWRRGWDSNLAKSLPSTTYGISETLKTPETLKTLRVGTIQER